MVELFKAAGIELPTNEGANAERSIDAFVYRLFDLSSDEIVLLEGSFVAPS